MTPQDFDNLRAFNDLKDISNNLVTIRAYFGAKHFIEASNHGYRVSSPENSLEAIRIASTLSNLQAGIEAAAAQDSLEDIEIRGVVRGEQLRTPEQRPRRSHCSYVRTYLFKRRVRHSSYGWPLRSTY